ncbi:MAG: hypothetical protein CEN91_484 [Candidatus Berkelbacteria bacterium Licking1014_85]|uniref:Uncharacterized protein n=1 Tax=Candidatus Berkelbacteria bacterium Licking1014_85 TaxID=2017148 RepID=A0A554LHM9_9BACT|nr:MAG: hypothetical protein CEN91_484 [Candidatus Berkelbacteria bacterium Licking1014_85]
MEQEKPGNISEEGYIQDIDSTKESKRGGVESVRLYDLRVGDILLIEGGHGAKFYQKIVKRYDHRNGGFSLTFSKPDFKVDSQYLNMDGKTVEYTSSDLDEEKKYCKLVSREPSGAVEESEIDSKSEEE